MCPRAVLSEQNSGTVAVLSGPSSWEGGGFAFHVPNNQELIKVIRWLASVGTPATARLIGDIIPTCLLVWTSGADQQDLAHVPVSKEHGNCG